MTRKFTATKAVRKRVPMLVGLVGASGSGKTYSALRLATGMAEVTGGRVIFIDTESKRALHYADDFDFDHVEMEEPFSPLDYLAAIEQFTDQKNVLVIDSMSHEHEGPGGVLDQHEKILDKQAGSDWRKRNKLTFGAWAKPKAQRRQLINAVLRLGCNAVFCFRAKEKLKLESGKDPVNLGWQAIAGEEFVFEMTVSHLLYPGSNGVPVLMPDNRAEAASLKHPHRFKDVFPNGSQLDEKAGRRLAEWAAGAGSKAATPDRSTEDRDTGAETPDLGAALAEIGSAESHDDLESTRQKWGKAGKWGQADIDMLKQAVQARRGQLDVMNVADDGPEPPEDDTGDPPASDEAPEDPATRAAFGLDPE